MTLQITVEEYREYVRTGRLPSHVEETVKRRGSMPLYLKEDASPRTAGTRFAGLNAGAVRTRGVRNKSEEAWERVLEEAKEAGEIVGEIKFEEVKVRVTDAIEGERAVWYTFDFFYTLADGTVCCDDVKGAAVNEASIVRIKAAASRHPQWRFRIVTKLPKGEWDIRQL